MNAMTTLDDELGNRRRYPRTNVLWSGEVAAGERRAGGIVREGFFGLAGVFEATRQRVGQAHAVIVGQATGEQAAHLGLVGIGEHADLEVGEAPPRFARLRAEQIGRAHV